MVCVRRGGGGQEKAMLRLRMEELGDEVEAFVVVEGDRTFKVHRTHPT